MELSEIYLEMAINKSNPGEMDSDGNYIFEVEASNENLDLQNQIIQQNALIGSKDYFLTNGVISDDHQHKTKDDEGNVETHHEKIIGEPISIWTDGSRTFVKGKLYGNNKYAKNYINLLKANSTRVHASVGGIMPRVKKNADGTETVTSFMWNDLALTCSPVNWTVGHAVFAKSMTNVDFCKALTAGSGTDTATFENGRALQKEDVENKVTNVISSNELNKPNDIQKADDDVIRECIISIDNGELQTERQIKKFLVERGFSKMKAAETVKEIIEEGERKMKKSGFLDTMIGISKSFGKKPECKKSEDSEPDDEQKKKKDESNPDDDELINIDDDEFKNNDDDEGEKRMQKSFEESNYDVTDVIYSLSQENENLKSEIENLKKSLEETNEGMMIFAKSLQDYMNTPNLRKSIMTKETGIITPSENVKVKPDAEDFKTFKAAITKSIQDGAIDTYKVTALSSAFQKSMRGEEIARSDWTEICRIVKKYNS